MDEQLIGVQLSFALFAVMLVVVGEVGGGHEMERLVPLSVPVMEGFDPITRMRYAEPATVEEGIVALIVPDVVAFSVPIDTGDEKFPAASESCAVNTFPVLNAPVVV